MKTVNSSSAVFQYGPMPFSRASLISIRNHTLEHVSIARTRIRPPIEIPPVWESLRSSLQCRKTLCGPGEMPVRTRRLPGVSPLSDMST